MSDNPGQPAEAQPSEAHRTEFEGPDDLAITLAALELREVDEGGDGSNSAGPQSRVFVGDPGPGDFRLFGGLVAAQSLVAAAGTVSDRIPHSVHCQFLRPGKHGELIEFEVVSLREGGSFSTRRVMATQGGKAIFEMTAGFAREEVGLEHQGIEMEKVEGPDNLPNREEERFRRYGRQRVVQYPNAVDMRLTNPLVVEPGVELPAVQNNWVRSDGTLPEDPLIHTAILLYSTDRGLLSTAAQPHALDWDQRMSASLDHAVWFHRPVCMDDWHLVQCCSPIARGGRAMLESKFFRQSDGALVATVAQEALIRRRR